MLKKKMAKKLNEIEWKKKIICPKTKNQLCLHPEDNWWILSKKNRVIKSGLNTVEAYGLFYETCSLSSKLST